MKKKIVITGGLGYIGTELCKIYSGYSWNDEITVIDNRFVSERVNQLRNWNMNFVQGNILDKEIIKKYCKDADIVHHLAGITDVPRVKSESSSEKDDLINKVAEEGTQNILDVISENCKIIMPSSHVVYEGLESIKKDINENEIVKNSEIVVQLGLLNEEKLSLLKENQTLVGSLNVFLNKEKLQSLKSKKINCFSLELLPRITRAQSMDILSSQANLAGYKAVIEAFQVYERAIPMMMTAAGTIPAAKVLVVGAGVAGLQAIATAKRMGAVVFATDVRIAS